MTGMKNLWEIRSWNGPRTIGTSTYLHQLLGAQKRAGHLHNCLLLQLDVLPSNFTQKCEEFLSFSVEILTHVVGSIHPFSQFLTSSTFDKIRLRYGLQISIIHVLRRYQDNQINSIYNLTITTYCNFTADRFSEIEMRPNFYPSKQKPEKVFFFNFAI